MSQQRAINLPTQRLVFVSDMVFTARYEMNLLTLKGYTIMPTTLSLNPAVSSIRGSMPRATDYSYTVTWAWNKIPEV
jgi:hypothetical protein